LNRAFSKRNMGKIIVISGGTGLIGSLLSSHLKSLGNEVRILSRKSSNKDDFFRWDPEAGVLDSKAIENAEVLIHLAGAGIADYRWSESRKEEIINSRVDSTLCIKNALSNYPNNINTVIAASAIGYYGGDRGEFELSEESDPGDDFLAHSCDLWEEATSTLASAERQLYTFRFGIVLDKRKGALPKISAPFKFGVGSQLGNGKQWMPWIHGNDVVKAVNAAINHEFPSGTYNVTSPNPARNKALSRELATVLKVPLWAPPVPKFILTLFFGEMSIAFIGSCKVLPVKLLKQGFKFDYPDLSSALTEIYSKKK
jgi:uncharacterized protein (TIGR01777 family)